METSQFQLGSQKLAAGALLGVPIAICVALIAAQVADAQAGWTAIICAIALVLYLIAAAAVLRLFAVKSARLEEMAMSDSLTGLPNRRALHRDIGAKAIPGEELAVALVNLDGFKSVNDFYGHSVGDRVIAEFGKKLVGRLEDTGTVYRLGGDEFALVVSGPLAGNILEGICRRILQAMAEPIRIDDRSIAIDASIGLARGTADRAAISSILLRQADVAVQVAKERGKSRVTWFSEDFERDRDMLREIDLDLRAALDRGELQVHYQPLIDCRSGKIGAVEALIRWERADGRRIGPDQFIPVAEETGLIEPIGLFVLRRACNDAVGWDGIKVSVNVSVAQLRNTQFPLQLDQILEETGFPAERLELEITETFLVGDPLVAGRNLEMLRDFGVGIVLDDYGTGYASIGFLRRFRFEKLKLDRSLIVDAADDEATRTVMASSVTMAKALGMRVTAEGIETEVQATLARTAGCDQMQGWLYSKAVPAAEIAAQLADTLHGLVPHATTQRQGYSHGA